MANYHQQFATAIPMSKEAAEFAIELAKTVNNIGAIPAGHVASPPPSDEVFAIAKTFVDPANDYELGSSFEYRDEKELFITDEEGQGNMTLVANILQAVMKKFDMKDPISVQWADICNVARPGGFGGGAFVLTAEQQHWMITDSWVETTLKGIGASTMNLSTLISLLSKTNLDLPVVLDFTTDFPVDLIDYRECNHLAIQYHARIKKPITCEYLLRRAMDMLLSRYRGIDENTTILVANYAEADERRVIDIQLHADRAVIITAPQTE